MAKPTPIIAAIILISLVSTSIGAAELEITAETDKAVYSFGEDVIVTVTVRSPTDAPITLHFGSSCKANYLMDDWFEPAQSCLWIITSIVLDPNESYTDTFVHNHWQQYRCPLLPGKHTVAGTVPGYGHGDAIEFEVRGRAPTIYVSTAGNDITGNGSIDNPFATIQRGVNTELLGATVIVRPGTYRGPGNTDINFEGKGVILRSETSPEDCIIDCNGSDAQHHRAFNFTAGEGRATVIDGFTITNGQADYGGAALCKWADPTIIHCIFRNCNADYGGAVYLFDSSSAFSNCIFNGNSAGRGAAIAAEYTDATLLNCTCCGNQASVGRAIYSVADSWPHTIRLKNCILWDKMPRIIGREINSRGNATVEVTYSDVQGGYLGGGNIDSDPCFVLPGYFDHRAWVEGDYHLLPDSPCIDAGDPNYVGQLNDTDLDGNPRIADGNADCTAVVDMGAYEFFIPPIEVPMKLTPRTLNLTSKGKWVKAHLVLPEGFGIEDVDSNLLPGIVEPFELQCDHMDIFLNDNNLVELEVVFDRAQFCRSTRPREIVELKVEGSLADCRRFYGMDTIKTLDKTAEYLVGLASYWLEHDCQKPDWCGGFDITQDGVVNFLDFVRTEPVQNVILKSLKAGSGG